ncbi:MAG: tetratricopeptide repeat protein [Planctomycetota bacterium]|jgi:tetratricopeptide (TPR) repeat protein
MDRAFGKYGTAVICAFLVFSGVLVYSRLLGADFVNFDDPIYVSENEHVSTGLTGENVLWAFSSTDVSYWHPLTWLSHMLDCEVFGLRPGLHHLSNLVLHIVNSVLVFLVFRQMTGALWRSGFLAAFFALHPLNVDSVAWVAERKNVLSTLFWLLTMWAYVRYAHRVGAWRYLLTLLFYALGLLAKPMLVTVPFVLLLLDYWPLGRVGLGSGDAAANGAGQQLSVVFRLVREKVPFFVLSAASVYWYCRAVERPGTAISREFVPVGLRIANALVSYAGYMGKMIWPSGLAVYYPFPDAVALWKTAGALLVLVCISVFVIVVGRRKRYLLVGWLWFLGTLVPVIGLYQAGLWPAMADRWAYVPLVGLFVMVAWGGGDLGARWSRQRLLSVAAGVWLAALMACTWVQVGHWHDGFTLFTRALEVTRDNFIAHYNLGNILLRRQETEKAIAHYKEAIAIHPRYVDAHYNLGIAFSDKSRYAEAIGAYQAVLRLKKGHKKVLFRLGDALAKNGQLDEALGCYSRSLEQKPDDVEVLNNFALALVKKGQIDRAIELYNKSLAITPGSVEVLNNLGNALVKQGEFAEAVGRFREALVGDADFGETHYNLANALKEMGQTEEAIEHYQEALRLKPDNIDAHYGLGLVLAQLKRYDQAATHYSKAVELNPDFGPGYYHLGVVFFNQDKIDEAIVQFRQVLRIHPDDAEMHCNLGILLAKKGSIDEAIEEFRSALRLEPGFSKARQQLEAALDQKAVSVPP